MSSLSSIAVRALAEPWVFLEPLLIAELSQAPCLSRIFFQVSVLDGIPVAKAFAVHQDHEGPAYTEEVNANALLSACDLAEFAFLCPDLAFPSGFPVFVNRFDALLEAFCSHQASAC